MKRYFIYSFFQTYNNGGKSTVSIAITDGCFPSKRALMLRHKIYRNQLYCCSISEVKSVQDLSDFLGKEIEDKVNYPFESKPSDD